MGALWLYLSSTHPSTTILASKFHKKEFEKEGRCFLANSGLNTLINAITSNIFIIVVKG
jgi:hypothetical protein